jgi:phage-related protein
MEVHFFNDRTQRFFESLPSPIKPRAVKTTGLLQIYGYRLGMPHSKPIGGGLFELRIVGQAQIRFIYAFHDDKIWILHGFMKKTQRISSADLAYARSQRTLLLQ